MESKITYQKIASHEAKKGTFDKCVLLYSGGLDTSIMLKWIQEAYACSIVALTVDVGQLHDSDCKSQGDQARCGRGGGH
ncbi:MAG: argininosuccinate synthase [Nitrospirales bacterium]|nr:argininosuccinate synthase [Nitrospirales bacterium]